MLRMLMAKHQITVKALSIESDISRTSISAILNERTLPWHDTCYIITDAFNELCGKEYKADKLFPHMNQLRRYDKKAR